MTPQAWEPPPGPPPLGAPGRHAQREVLPQCAVTGKRRHGREMQALTEAGVRGALWIPI